jgi:hypothetical protein
MVLYYMFIQFHKEWQIQFIIYLQIMFQFFLIYLNSKK